MELTKSFPILGESFAEVIRDGLFYVDKTDMVANLARRRRAFFLSRPRRFGKSLLLTTFQELFENGTKSFKGLKLDKEGLWTDTSTYKVVKLSFTSSATPEPGQTFYQTFGNKLKEQCLRAGLAWTDKPNWTDSFDDVLYNADNSSIVLLIDEYDAPLTHVLDKPAEYETRRDYLAKFYSTLKDFADKFRFVFITGVTRITHLGLFSGPNNIKDISFESEYGAITGFTQEEIEQNFKPYITNAAKVLKKEYPQEQWDEQKVLSELKSNYDGYSFDRRAKHKVYNPWSVINFFASPSDGFLPHWLNSSNSTLVDRFLERLTGNSDDLLKMLDFLGNVPKSYEENKLSPVISHLGKEDFPVIAVLYQSGYLTIKKTFNTRFTIGIPNNEVKTAFANAVIERLKEKKAEDKDDDDDLTNDEYLRGITKAFATCNLTAIKEVMNKIINQYSYECFKNFNERMFSEVLGSYIFVLTKFSYEGIREVQSAKGRADLHIRGRKYRYIIEVKVVKDREKADEAFEEGKRQFLDRKYADLIEPLTIVPCVMVIVNEPKMDKKSSPTRIRGVVHLEEISLTEDELGKLEGR